MREHQVNQYGTGNNTEKKEGGKKRKEKGEKRILPFVSEEEWRKFTRDVIVCMWGKKSKNLIKCAQWVLSFYRIIDFFDVVRTIPRNEVCVVCCVCLCAKWGERGKKKKLLWLTGRGMITVVGQRHNSDDQTHSFRRKENESHGE